MQLTIHSTDFQLQTAGRTSCVIDFVKDPKDPADALFIQKFPIIPAKKVAWLFTPGFSQRRIQVSKISFEVNFLITILYPFKYHSGLFFFEFQLLFFLTLGNSISQECAQEI